MCFLPNNLRIKYFFNQKNIFMKHMIIDEKRIIYE
jgi:hypothetical protein